MDLLLGLPGLIVRDVIETFEETRVIADVEGAAPTCTSCGTDAPMNPHGMVETKFWDAPLRGRRSRLIVRRRRFICGCRKTTSLAMPKFAEEDFPSLTMRLVRYIENEAFRRTAPSIAEDTGPSETMVRRVAGRLAHHLWDNHRFPTPQVLGIDDLRIKKSLYTVITDGRTGRAIALVDSGKELDIRREMHRRQIDTSLVKVVVSDMGGSNIAVFRKLFSAPVIHVADKWHVLKGVNEALRLVINKRIDRLRRRRALWVKRLEKIGLTHAPKRGPVVLEKWNRQIKTLNDAKKALLGGRIVKSKQGALFDVRREIVEPICKRYHEIGNAFFAKLRLHAVYVADTRAAADRQVDRFFLRAGSKRIAAQMKVIVDRVKTHRDMILNYHDAVAILGPSHPAPTTGPTEQRNSTIKGAWRAARKFTDHKAFAMRALYEPWQIDTDIAICWGGKMQTTTIDGKQRYTYCPDVTGPFPGQGRGQMVVPPLHRHRCPIH